MTKIMNIVLDLDQTLISAEATEEYDHKKNKDKAKLFDFHNMDNYYIVFERPGLQNFLDYLFENFNVSVWTAASKNYAMFIIDKVLLKDKPNRKLNWVFFSEHCDMSKKNTKNSKNLKILWKEFKIDNMNKDNTIILDDYDEVYETQPNNCIFVPPFEFTDDKSENDNFLLDLQVYLDNFNKSGIKSISSINKKIENKK